MVDANDQPRITDFGLAKRFGVESQRELRVGSHQSLEAGAPFDSQLTLTGQVLGSPSYMPPEQATGKRGTLSPRTEVCRFQGSLDEVWTLNFLHDGNTIVSGDKGGGVRFWSLADTNRNQCHTQLPRRVRGLVFTPDSRNFLVGSEDGPVGVWDTWPARELRSLPALGTNHYDLTLAANGRWLAVGDRTGGVRIWEWRDQRSLTNLPAPPALYGVLHFSPHGRFLLAGLGGISDRPIIRIWDTRTWRELPIGPVDSPHIEGERVTVGSADAMAFSPDEQAWAVGYVNGSVKLWGLPAGQLLATFTGHSSRVVGLAFSPDSQTLVSTSEDGFVNLWDVSAHRSLAKFRGDRNAARGPAFSWDGRRLVTSGRSQNAVKLWDMVTLRELIALPAQGTYFVRTSFSPDANTLAAIGVDGVAHVWHAPSFAEIEAAERKPQSP